MDTFLANQSLAMESKSGAAIAAISEEFSPVAELSTLLIHLWPQIDTGFADSSNSRLRVHASVVSPAATAGVVLMVCCFRQKLYPLANRANIA